MPAERVREAFSLGLKAFGENRVQEAEEKKQLVGVPGAEWHLIGQLQTNKARKAIELFDVIQSVDRPKLAETLNRIAGELGKRQRCLIEVKVSSEQSKSGVPLNEADAFIKSFAGAYKNLELKGLMTIGELDVSAEQTRQSFRRLASQFQSNKDFFGEEPVLSMGMSDDFEIAIEEGSTMVRIGRALFGERI